LQEEKKLEEGLMGETVAFEVTEKVQIKSVKFCFYSKRFW
jgi:hypothetical protein